MAEESFSAAWLALREGADHRSRVPSLLPRLEAAWRECGWSRILDLGSGTGSNLRYLAPRLPGSQRWTLLDRDPALLAHTRAAEMDPAVRRIRGELAREGLAEARHTDLVTGSALLDLVSEDWLRRLVDTCRSATAGALFALTYDGAIEWSEEDPEDEPVRCSVNAHQRRDKGLGPALGPAAGEVAEGFFREAGYRTWLVASPWRLGAGDAELVRALVNGWESTAWEQAPGRTSSIRAWAERRRHALGTGGSGVRVGHLDLLALPEARSPGP